MQVIIIIWWVIKLLKTYFCSSWLETNQWNVHCFTPVYDWKRQVRSGILYEQHISKTLRCSKTFRWDAVWEAEEDIGSLISIAWILPGGPLQRRHNEHRGVANHQRLDCLFNRLFRITPKKTSKHALLVLSDGIPSVTSGVPSQRASNAETVSTDDVIMQSKIDGYSRGSALPLKVDMQWKLA